MNKPMLHVATIANNAGVYANLRRSMHDAGFTEDTCRFTLFDNSQANRFDPYQVLRDLPTDGDEPYIMLCHQDLELGPATTFEILMDRLRELDETAPRWAVAGTAGVNSRGTPVVHLDDPNGSIRATHLPRRVTTLDENMLIFRRDRYVPPTPGLSGFHLYATDVCLNALLQRRTAHVIDFPIRHLSAGNPDQSPFYEARQALGDAWRDKLLVGIVSTTCGHVRVSRWQWLQRLLQKRWVVGTLRRLRLDVVPAFRSGRA